MTHGRTRCFPNQAARENPSSARENPIDQNREPRLKHSNDAGDTPKADHPFFWAGYLLVDTGPRPEKVPEQPAAAPMPNKLPQPANPAEPANKLPPPVEKKGDSHARSTDCRSAHAGRPDRSRRMVISWYYHADDYREAR